MGQFSQAVKYLDYVQGRKATPDDLHTSGSLPDPEKYLKLTKSRALKKIPYKFTLEPASQFFGPFDSIKNHRLLFQWDITFPSDFYILHADPVDYWLNFAILAVKWRVGTKVFRYKLAHNVGIQAKDKLYILDYSNQKISKNFCLEIWGTTGDVNGEVGIVNPVTVETSLITNPPDADTQELSLDVDAALTVTDLAFNLPATWPIEQNNLVWLDN